MAKCPKCGFEFYQAARSMAQNRTYWLLTVTPMAEAAGCTPEDMHECLKEELLGEFITMNTKNGVQIKRRVGSTTDMTKKEFSEYQERCAEIAARVYGISIRQPHQEDPTGQY